MNQDDIVLNDDSGRLTDIRMVLSEREYLVLKLKFADGLNQTEIGERIGVSQAHASRIIAEALDKLRTAKESGLNVLLTFDC